MSGLAEVVYINFPWQGQEWWVGILSRKREVAGLVLEGFCPFGHGHLIDDRCDECSREHERTVRFQAVAVGEVS
jgi:hypothetical protein